MNIYLESIDKIFHQYKAMAEKAIEQLEENDLQKIPAEESNSIAIIIKHVAGNMLSRFTDFLTSDGEKPWRNRDAEFEPDTKNKGELIIYWNKGWDCLFNTLNLLRENDLAKLVYIRGEAHTVLEALNRQMAHYSYHIGQIVYLAKMLKGSEFRSLSIPKGASGIFNAEKFGKKP